MRPYIAEMLTRGCEVLAETILPEVSSDYARTQLQYLIAALRDVGKSSDIYPRLAEENAALEDLLAAIRNEVGRAPREDADLSKEVLALLEDGGGRADSGRFPGFSEVSARNQHLRLLLVHVIRTLHERAHVPPERPWVVEVRGRIRRHLSDILARDAALGVDLQER